ncbi:hypothetical protein HPG69_016785 [Diceros bicornis minor]|uniref:Uncharacterized protein n=1 Tax=Diceros bicornis minor TaxID=77932 RepID=A0A7J7EBG5_DICBM|nr:hypothetical protein HPG69_016785 [Diceros bicornis minor]
MSLSTPPPARGLAGPAASRASALWGRPPAHSVLTRISAEYTGGSHYAVQFHDDPGDGTDDHEATMVQKQVSENKLYILPSQVWQDKEQRPTSKGQTTQDGKECVQECVSSSALQHSEQVKDAIERVGRHQWGGSSLCHVCLRL